MKALNVKIALLTCVGVTVAMCWLVSQVSRPISSAAAASTAVRPPATTTPPRNGNAADRMTRSNPIDSTRSAGRGQQETVQVRNSTVSPDNLENKLPPVSVPSNLATEVVAAPNATPRRDEARLASARELEASAARHAESPIAAVPEANVAGDKTLTAIRSESGWLSSPMEPEERLEPKSAEPEPRVTVASRYEVKRGDTLASIAKATMGRDDGRSMQALLAANPKLKSRPNKVYLGETLKIPGEGDGESKPKSKGSPGKTEIDVGERKIAFGAAGKNTASSPTKKPIAGARSKATTPKSASATGSNKKKPGTATAVASKSAAATKRGNPSAKTQWYTVKDKETLPAIARRLLKNENRWREIQALNGLKPGEKVAPGTKLKVPASRDT